MSFGTPFVDSMDGCEAVEVGGVVTDGVVGGVGDSIVVSEPGLSTTLVAGTSAGGLADEIVG